MLARAPTGHRSYRVHVKRTAGGLGVVAAAVLVALGAVTPTASSAVASTLVPAGTAPAAATGGWADWEPLDGAPGDWSTTVRLPATGFPAATVTSDARGGVGVVSGASSWLGPATPPGEVFGSSRGQAYLNLRPQADRADAPSTTTYTFERPTPGGGWAFVLGDIDADRAVVTALGADGRELTAGELGWQGGFNYCGGAGSPSCVGDPADVATWDPGTQELAGNAAAADTAGAAGWFRPTTPVASLTVTFFRRAGFPVYQTWFASLGRDVAGTVRLVDAAGTPQGVLPDARLTLFAADGTEIATTTSDASGQYGFDGVTAAPGYRVELTDLPEAGELHPHGLVAVGERVADEIDLREADATGVDFAARDVVPVAVSGTVLTDDGDPVAGATVTLAPVGGGAVLTAVTDSTGAYLVDRVGQDGVVGLPQQYTFALSGLPEGFVVGSAPDPVTVRPGQEEPSTGNDFVVRAPASVSGTVTSGGEPVAGVVVRIDGEGGAAGTTTGADGTYRFEDVLPGDHTVTVEAPDGYRPDGPDARDVTVGRDDVTGVDFALVTPGAVGGTVTDPAGEPVGGVTVTVTGPDGAVERVTDAEGGYFVGDLPQGDHTVAVTVPDGCAAEVTERTVTITAAGESLLAEDFVVACGPEPSASPSPSATGSPSAGPTGGPSPEPGPGPGGPDRGDLAATGAMVGSVALAAAVLAGVGVGLVRASRRIPPPPSGR